MGAGDPAWAARYGGGVPRSRYTQPPSPGPSLGRAGPRTYVAPYISNQHYGTVSCTPLNLLPAAPASFLQCLPTSLQTCLQSTG